jgi:hypothetical protein
MIKDMAMTTTANILKPVIPIKEYFSRCIYGSGDLSPQWGHIFAVEDTSLPQVLHLIKNPIIRMHLLPLLTILLDGQFAGSSLISDRSF